MNTYDKMIYDAGRERACREAIKELDNLKEIFGKKYEQMLEEGYPDRQVAWILQGQIAGLSRAFNAVMKVSNRENTDEAQV